MIAQFVTFVKVTFKSNLNCLQNENCHFAPCFFMVLKVFYVEDKVFTKYKGYYYLRVFEHNFTTANCFNNVDEALEVNLPGKFSILSHLNQSEFKFRDNKLNFIIEYPNENIYNSWTQSLPPYDDIDVEGVFQAKGFSATETLAPYGKAYQGGSWGGLVRNNIQKLSLLDGIPGHSNWYYAIGMLCGTGSDYLSKGIPNNVEVSNRVRLFASVPTVTMNIPYYMKKILCTPIVSSYILSYAIILSQVLITL